MSHGIRPLGPVGPAAVPIQVAQARATQTLLNTQGGAINLNAQRDVMMNDDTVMARKKEADKRLPARGLAVGMVDALAPTSAHSARSTGHDDEHEADDHSNRGSGQRRKKRNRVPPAYKP